MYEPLGLKRSGISVVKLSRNAHLFLFVHYSADSRFKKKIEKRQVGPVSLPCSVLTFCVTLPSQSAQELQLNLVLGSHLQLQENGISLAFFAAFAWTLTFNFASVEGLIYIQCSHRKLGTRFPWDIPSSNSMGGWGRSSRSWWIAKLVTSRRSWRWFQGVGAVFFWISISRSPEEMCGK